MPSIETTRSPDFSPARAPGLPGVTLATSAPRGCATPSPSAISGVTAWKLAPTQGSRTGLPALAEFATTRTMFEGMAKPIPLESPVREKIAVLIPTRPPFMSISAPPELPGLIAASVWMKNW